MRLALISDLHGNELALDAVLSDASRAGYDRLVCLGDVATLGPRPSEVLARLRDLGCRQADLPWPPMISEWSQMNALRIERARRL